MKKWILLFAFTCLTLYPSGIKIGSIPGFVFNQLNQSSPIDIQMEITYISNNNEFNYRYIISITGDKRFERVILFLSEDQIDEIQITISKYFDWEELAIQNGEVIDKEIFKLHNVISAFNVASEIYYAGNDPSIRIRFHSQNPEKHQMVWEFSKLQSKHKLIIPKEGAITRMPPPIVFVKESVEKLALFLSEEGLNNTLEFKYE